MKPSCIMYTNIFTYIYVDFPLQCQARNEAGAARISFVHHPYKLKRSAAAAKSVRSKEVPKGSARPSWRPRACTRPPSQKPEKGHRWAQDCSCRHTTFSRIGTSRCEVPVPLRRGVCVYPANGQSPAVKNANVAAKVWMQLLTFGESFANKLRAATSCR